MPKDLSDLKVCIFDVFGTVVDWRGSLIEDLPKLGKKYGLETDWASFADDWRGLYQPQMSRVRKGELPWTRIDDLHKEAFEMLVTGEFIDAREAKARGLVNRVVEPEDLDMEVNRLVGSILSKPRVAIALGKELFYRQAELGIAAAYDLAGQTMACNMMEDSALEGVQAFIEKRAPRW